MAGSKKCPRRRTPGCMHNHLAATLHRGLHATVPPPPLLASFIARSLCSALVPPPPTGAFFGPAGAGAGPPLLGPVLRLASSARAVATWYARAAAAEPDERRRPRDEGRGEGGV